MELIYKTLFEVKLLHEYFVKREDGSSILNEPDAAKRAAEMETAFSQDREHTGRDISFEFPETLRLLYESQGLKIIPSFAGCRVLCRVVRTILPDKSELFAPIHPLPSSMNIFISLNRRNNIVDVYTNGRLVRSIPSTYIFSSENINGPRVFPFLTNPVAAYNASHKYEQGELSVAANGKLQEALYDHQGNFSLFQLDPSLIYLANESDRLLLPLQFKYSIMHSSPVHHLEFLLQDAGGTEVKKLSFDKPDPIKNLVVDFSDKEQQLRFTGTPSLSLFTLSVTSDNGYSETRTIAFDRDLYKAGNWGLIHLRPKNANSAFNLVDSSGFIARRKNALGIWTEAPVFEIMLKSRLGHFRYLNNKGRQLALNPSLQNFLAQENGALISRMPVSLSHYYSMVPDSGSSTTRYLPQPVNYDMKKDSSQRIFFDVFVPESDLFPIVH